MQPHKRRKLKPAVACKLAASAATAMPKDGDKLDLGIPELSELGRDFEPAHARTVQALTAIAARWRDEAERRSSEAEAHAEAVAEAIDKVLGDPEAFSSEGFAWSREAGLAFVLPSGALQCQPLAQSVGADGLIISTVGGPVVPTHPGLIVAPAPPCGFGVFTTVPLRKDTKLGEYLGTARNFAIWEKDIEEAKVTRRGCDARVPFIRDELYAAWTGAGPMGAGVVVDAFAAGNAMRFINCSCSPNATFVKFGEGHQSHCRLEVQTLRDIGPYEQLCVNYAWYLDDSTLEDVRAEAMKAFNRDVGDLNSLGTWFSEQSALAGGAAADLMSEPPPSSLIEGRSEAVRVVAEAAGEARGPPRLRTAPRSFLRRFIDPPSVAIFLERTRATLEEVGKIEDIPDALWPMYEVVGGDSVGIPCRCGWDPSLNAGGLCSGIIGRPMQATFDGRSECLERIAW